MLAEEEFTSTTSSKVTLELLDHKKADCAF